MGGDFIIFSFWSRHVFFIIPIGSCYVYFFLLFCIHIHVFGIYLKWGACRGRCLHVHVVSKCWKCEVR